MARTITMLVVAALLSASHGTALAKDEIRHEVYATASASSLSRVALQQDHGGFNIGYELVPIRWVLLGASGGWRAPAKVNNRGLQYDLSFAEGMIYLGGRFSLDFVTRGRGKAAPGGLRFLGGNEFSLGATLGLSHYMQKVRAEAERTATHPFAGFFVCWNYWFLDWLGLHVDLMFHWNLTEVSPGVKGLLRKEFHLGPTFRF